MLAQKFQKRSVKVVPVISTLAKKSIGMLVAQVHWQCNQDDADNGGQNAHHNHFGLRK